MQNFKIHGEYKMKRLLPLIALSCFAIYLGCSSKDEPTKPDPETIYRVVAYKANEAPDMDDVDDPVWSSAKATTLDMKPAGALPQSIGATQMGPKISYMQAITNAGYLYLRFVWADATNDIWRDGYYVSDLSGFVQLKQFNPLTVGEDQLVVMFDNLSGEGWDAWNWRAASLAPSGLAEDMWFEYVDSFFTIINIDTTDTVWMDSSGTQVIDSFVIVYDTTKPPAVLPHFVNDASTPQVPTVAWPNDNYGVSSEPTYVHQDTSEFHDSVLYWTEAIDRDDTLSVDSFWVDNPNPPPDSIWVKNARFWPQTKGWQLDQKVPGYLIDTAATHRPAAELGSLYEIQCASLYRGEEHRVVMRRLLNTGQADDLNLNSDSVKTRVVIAENKYNLFQADTDRSTSKDVWLILK